MSAESHEWKNKLYFGENLDVLRKEIASESVDLVYLDPPFNSNVTYNVLFKEKTGKESAAQITAFDDTWHWTLGESGVAYEEIVKGPNRLLSDLIQAMRRFLGENDMMAYLVMMGIRLVELRRVLKSTGSIYLHCDPTASHYLKLIMDGLFGFGGYRNEITWKRTTAHSDTRQGRREFGNVNDILLYYTKSERHVFNPQYLPYDENYLRKYSYVDADGRRYRLDNLTGPGGAAKGNPAYEVMGIVRHWRYSRENMEQLIADGRVIQTKPGTVPQYKRYLDEMPGVPLQNLWDDIPPINSQADERMGYPTQKPEALLERIIKASSNEGDVVLDPFCGCGTAVAVGERLRRRWVGIDITHLAIDLIVRRLRRIANVGPYTIRGYPEDLAGAEALAAQQDKYQFQWWAVLKAGGDWSEEMKKGADRGIDGVITFFDDFSGQAKRVIIQVKSGQHPSVNDVRVLKAVIEREKAPIGALIILKGQTREMAREAAIAGYYTPQHFPGRRFPRIQILTIEEILAGKRIEHPELSPSVVKQAERKTKDEQRPLF